MCFPIVASSWNLGRAVIRGDPGRSGLYTRTRGRCKRIDRDNVARAIAVQSAASRFSACALKRRELRKPSPGLRSWPITSSRSELTDDVRDKGFEGGLWGKNVGVNATFPRRLCGHWPETGRLDALEQTRGPRWTQQIYEVPDGGCGSEGDDVRPPAQRREQIVAVLAGDDGAIDRHQVDAGAATPQLLDQHSPRLQGAREDDLLA